MTALCQYRRLQCVQAFETGGRANFTVDCDKVRDPLLELTGVSVSVLFGVFWWR